MLLTSENLSEIKYKTKRVKLEKADAEINVALVPVSLVQEAIEANKTGDNEDTVGLKILLSSVVDDNRNPVFTSPSDFESLPLAVKNEIMKAVLEYNGFKKPDELEKN